jgi:hypothetical protein
MFEDYTIIYFFLAIATALLVCAVAVICVEEIDKPTFWN